MPVIGGIGMKVRFAALATGIALFGFLLVAPAAAAPPATQTQGAAGLVNALVGLNNTLSQDQVGLVNVGNSLNNLTALNNVLNNSPILSGNNVLNGSPILNNSLNNLQVIKNVLIANGSLNGNTITAANGNTVDIGQVLGVAVLNGGGIAVIV
jgi:hypothetical protein